MMINGNKDYYKPTKRPFILFSTIYLQGIYLYKLYRLPDLEKRAYLARYLMPVQLPEEFQMDNDIKIQLDQIKDL